MVGMDSDIRVKMPRPKPPIEVKDEVTKKKPLINKKALLISILIIVLSGGGSIYLLQSQPSFVAKFADNVLRPSIGNKNTIILEDILFAFSDHVKQFIYGTVAKPKANIFNNVTPKQIKTAPVVTLQALDLKTISNPQPNFTPLDGEGQWGLVAMPQFNGKQIMARTFVRPDPDRSYAIVALIQMNMYYLSLTSVAGTYYPGAELGHPGPGVIPMSDRATNNLVAAFNGGFQYMDGHYGMTVGSTTYVPLTIGLGSLIIYDDDSIAIQRYDGTTPSFKKIKSVRQNGPLILDKGKITADAESGGYQVWGRTTTNSVYTWRSGVGLTAQGNLVYAVGPSLTASTLAQSLKLAGAQEAIQLDINQFWVRFVTFTPTGAGNYTSESILNTLQNGGPSYLSGYNKDFFYLMMKSDPVHKPSTATK
jgi:Phosphodiester glycosidase